MRAQASLWRAWLHGIGAFIGITAAFVLALSFAISGPPTTEEMSLLRGASNNLSRASDRVGAALCARLDGDVRRLAGCAPAPIVAEAPRTEAPPPRPPRIAAAPPPVRESGAVLAEPDLLGASDSGLRAPLTETPRAERPRLRAPPRRERNPVVFNSRVIADPLPPRRNSAPLTDAAIAPPLHSAQEPTPTKPSPAARGYPESRYWSDDESAYPEDTPDDRYEDDDPYDAYDPYEEYWPPPAPWR